MKTIKLAPGLDLPLETAVVQRYAFVGRPGTGKTNGAQLLAENFIENGVQTVVLDAAGVWWSLRASKDDPNKPSGLKVAIIGGKNGDIPIDPEQGAVYADWIVEKHASAVFDIKLLRPGKREEFVAEFLRQLYYRKAEAKIRTPLHLFLEEAQRYAPQNPDSKYDRMSLSALREIAEIGRNDAFGLTLLTPRPQALSKSVLNFTECLVAHQVNGSHERKAIREWAVDKDLTINDTDLTTLKIGEAYVWSPSWLEVMRKVKINLKRTYPASSTLKFGESMANIAPPLPEQALTELHSALAEATKHVEAKDPKVLLRRIADLEAFIARQPVPQAQVERIEIPVISTEQQGAIDRLAMTMTSISQYMQDVLKVMGDVREGITALVGKPGVPPTAAWPAKTQDDGKRGPPVKVPPALTDKFPPRSSSESKPDRAQLYILIALSQYGPARDGKQLALLSGYRYNRHLRNNLGTLRAAGYIVGENTGQIDSTLAGRSVISHYEARLDTPSALAAHWLEQFDKQPRSILSVLLEYPKGTDHKHLCEATGYSYNRHFRNSLGELRSAGVLIGPNTGTMKAAPELLG